MASVLKQARQLAGVSVEEIGRATRLSPRILAAIDEDRFDMLPAGIYARMAVRAYADALGLDATAVLAVLQPRLPDAPLDLASVAALRTPPPHARRDFRYPAAALVDAALLAAIVSTMVAVCAVVCGLPPRALVADAPAPMLLLCGTPIALYFWLLGATDVGTLGVRLLEVEILPAFDGPLRFDAWLRRGPQYALRELTLAVEGWRPNCYGPASTRD
jgi:hypothetical protein